MDREAITQPPSIIFSWMATLMLMVIPPVIIVQCIGGSWSWVLWGGLSWSIAVVLKIVITPIAYILLPSNLPSLCGICLGLISGIIELGIAAYLFDPTLSRDIILAEILAFSVGAGCTEILFVLASSLINKPQENKKVALWIDGAEKSLCVRNILLVERATALLGHIGARGLVCLSVYGTVILPAAIALATFSLTDGLASYGELKKLNWFEPRICRIFYGFCASLSVLEILLFAVVSMTVLR